jgi:putative membrane protein
MAAGFAAPPFNAIPSRAPSRGRSKSSCRLPSDNVRPYSSLSDNTPKELAMTVLLTWVINALALLIITYLVPSIHIRSFGTALIVALVLGLINALLRPVLLILTLPVTILTLGLFILVVNALCFWLAASLLKGFEVSGFWSAFFGSILYSIVSWLLSALIFGNRSLG